MTMKKFSPMLAQAYQWLLKVPVSILPEWASSLEAYNWATILIVRRRNNSLNKMTVLISNSTLIIRRISLNSSQKKNKSHLNSYHSKKQSPKGWPT